MVPRDRFTLDASLELRPGERVAIIGANGSGKSTLLAGLAGLTELARASTVTLGGHPWRSIPVEARGIGFIAQDGLLFPHLSVLDNVAFGPRSAGRSRRESREIAARMLEEVRVDHLAGAAASSVSGGERQRIALARALATEPSTLLLDEPFAALDVDASVEVREITAEQVRARGLSLLLVTHDLVDAVRLTDCVIVLESGKVVERLETRDLQRAPASAFAASFAGLARVPGTLATDALVTASGARIPLRGVEVDRSLRVGASALLLAAPDHVELVDSGRGAVGGDGEAARTDAGGNVAMSASSFADAVESLVGDGSAVRARLRSGLLARVDSERLPQAGAIVRVRIHHARLRPAP
ncbi:ATP-binding cassette domain-containing protein [Gulosibacter molinativorax]|uniref:ATP-binding cassette domain-containing protein n=1 Tax=Gulosibacter molinativorax TaxID=256821 RepID=UPI00040C8385|nr:ATP-binding cassette domain-containing protein [Gulosibacter molinativorax]QUY63562.1 Molybdate ABC transporter ATP-binding protein [Gulosibacter molinativorax]